jgi:hypothetical protein
MADLAAFAGFQQVFKRHLEAFEAQHAERERRFMEWRGGRLG